MWILGASFPFSQLIELGYRAGSGGAGRSHVLRFGRRGHCGPPLSDGLFLYSSMHRHDRGPRTPWLVGLPAAARHHFSLCVEGAAVDARARFGHVIFQSLPAAAINPGPGNQVSVIVAVRRAPACHSAQLTVRYRAGGFDAGEDSGGIIVRDTGARPCQPAGRVKITGPGPGGRPVTNTAAAWITPPGVLSLPRQPPGRAFALPGERPRDSPRGGETASVLPQPARAKARPLTCAGSDGIRRDRGARLTGHAPCRLVTGGGNMLNRLVRRPCSVRDR
jgi:hypothetical protein